jgi:Zn-dependent membrane protease YugP
MILAVPAILLILALVVGPQLWISSVMRRHGNQRPEIPWTGGEFARLLLDGMKLTGVKVEETMLGDHYHPLAKAVRLKTDHYFSHSLTAIVIAANEVGHAMQDATGYPPLQTRTRIAGVADFTHKVGAVFVVASPLIAAALRSPGGLIIGIVAAVLVKFDASFNRAVVVLKHGRFIPEQEMGAVHHILSAVAYTYVASALIDLINLPRLVRGLWV